MDRQALLNHFISQVNGKGQCQSKNGRTCRYALSGHPGHPGCSIGCQPEFQKAAEKLNVDLFLLNGTVRDHNVRMVINKAWPFLSEQDMNFLVALQYLHDQTPWTEGFLSPYEVQQFCIRFDLQVPD